jgi:hypothetical protein
MSVTSRGIRRERDRKYGTKVDEVTITGKVGDTLLWAGRKSFILLERSQASPARPSDMDSVKVKTL